MFIQILNNESIIINDTVYNYIKHKGRAIIIGMTDKKITEAVEYLLFKKEFTKPLTDPPAFRDVRRDGNTIGVIYMTIAGTYNAVIATPECDIRIESFMHEKLAKYFILTESFEPDVKYENIPDTALKVRKQLRTAWPGIFNMVYYHHCFAGFTFNHSGGRAEGFNIDFQRSMFNRRADAKEWIMKYKRDKV